ncbi:antigen 5 like allergen Cul n 1-like [Drosophila obscura]|uniref:antigen 5 like allergen Cul n 1-like n=1 Tax=Drosophila obscura TaxID=7282 RepID=UPI001BB193DF|nr:antigen 5 like allergen Cul n 1-like [Drosophila obscura]
MWWWLLLSFPWTIYAAENEWCDPSICGEGDTVHILCKDEGQFYSSCPEKASLVNLKKKDMDMITGVHNNLRNKVAGGEHKGWPKAAKMLTMQWDLELAMVAEAGARLCQLKKLYCATTTVYMWTGQNEAVEASHCLKNSDVILKKHLEDWIRQGEYATEAMLKDPLSGPTSAHFLQMIRDRCDRFGCAITCYTENEIEYQLMKCIYSCTIALSNPSNPVYVAAKSKGGDKCRAGHSKTYPSLCHKGEKAPACKETETKTTTSTPHSPGQKPGQLPPYPPPKYTVPDLPPNPTVAAPQPPGPHPSPPPYFNEPPPFARTLSMRTAAAGARAAPRRGRPRPRINSEKLSGMDYDFSDYVQDVDPCDTCTTTPCNLKYHCF